MASRDDIPAEDEFDERDLPQEQDLDDGNAPLEEDVEDEDESLGDAICPSCRKTVTEDTQKCPHCGDWITPEHPSSHGWRRWIFVAAVLVMVWALLRWMGVV